MFPTRQVALVETHQAARRSGARLGTLRLLGTLAAKENLKGEVRSIAVPQKKSLPLHRRRQWKQSQLSAEDAIEAGPLRWCRKSGAGQKSLLKFGIAR